MVQNGRETVTYQCVCVAAAGTQNDYVQILYAAAAKANIMYALCTRGFSLCTALCTGTACIMYGAAEPPLVMSGMDRVTFNKSITKSAESTLWAHIYTRPPVGNLISNNMFYGSFNRSRSHSDSNTSIYTKSHNKTAPKSAAYIART